MYKTGDQFPTENQLSLEFGVSRGTVRKALGVLEDQGILVRRPGKGTFIKSIATFQTERSRTANLIGLAIPHSNDQLSANILNGAERVMRTNGYGLVYTNLENHARTEREKILHLLAQGVSGIILFPFAAPGEAQMLHDLLGALPVVLVDRELPEFDGGVVMADHFAGAYTAVQHLQSLGHRKIAAITHPNTASSVSERLRGYEQAMRDAGLMPYATVPIFEEGRQAPGAIPIYSESEVRLVDHMLSILDRPTAVFCVNDNLATGVMHLALAKGLRIPDDLAIVGFDNSSIAQHMPVPLSSIEQNSIEMGVQAAGLLLRKIANPAEPNQRILIPIHLVVRASTVKV